MTKRYAPVKWLCTDCQTTFERRVAHEWRCPSCGGGRVMTVEAVERNVVGEGSLEETKT